MEQIPSYLEKQLRTARLCPAGLRRQSLTPGLATYETSPGEPELRKSALPTSLGPALGKPQPGASAAAHVPLTHHSWHKQEPEKATRKEVRPQRGDGVSIPSKEGTKRRMLGF